MTSVLMVPIYRCLQSELSVSWKNSEASPQQETCDILSNIQTNSQIMRPNTQNTALHRENLQQAQADREI